MLSSPSSAQQRHALHMRGAGFPEIGRVGERDVDSSLCMTRRRRKFNQSHPSHAFSLVAAIICFTRLC